MRPDYGTDLRKSMFEPMDSASIATLRAQISDTIAKYEPRVVLQQLNVFPQDELNTLTVQLVLSTKNDLLTTTNVEITV